MEINEKESKEAHIISSDNKYNIFKLEYGSQKIENNAGFQKWKAKIE